MFRCLHISCIINDVVGVLEKMVFRCFHNMFRENASPSVAQLPVGINLKKIKEALHNDD